MVEKFEGYTEVLNSLLAEAIGCSPETWDKGTLSIDCDGRQINYKLKNDGSPDKAQISDDLRRLCEHLYVTMRQAGDVWSTATIHFFRKDDSWGFKTNFEYSTPESAQQAAPPTKAARHPWWKFW